MPRGGPRVPSVTERAPVWSKKATAPQELYGAAGSLLGLAEGAEAFANPTSLGLKDSRLKPQPPHVYHYNQNLSFFRIALLSRVL